MSRFAERRVPRARWRFLGACAGLAMLSGCGTQDIVDSMAGGSSMRIQVEVYKGPLSKEVETQWGELAGVLREAPRSLGALNDSILPIAASKGFLTLNPKPLPALVPSEHDLKRMVAALEKLSAEFRAIAAEHAAKTPKGGAKKAGGDNEAASYREAALNTEVLRVDLAGAAQAMGKLLRGVKTGALTSDQRAFREGGLKVAFDRVARSLQGFETSIDKPTATFSWSPLVVSSCDAQGSSCLAKDIGAATKKAEALLLDGELKTALDARYRLHLDGPLSIRTGTGPGIRHTRVIDKVLGDDMTTSKGRFFWCNRPEIMADGRITSFSDLFYCRTLALLHEDTSNLIDELDNVVKIVSASGGSGETRALKDAVTGRGGTPFSAQLGRMSEVATRMKAKAAYWAEANVAATSYKREIRILITAFANTAAEYANQISSRADTLRQQCVDVGKNGACSGGIHRDKLPLSVFLRETNPTAFLNLYEYNRAATPAIAEEAVTRAPWDLGSVETKDRIRVVEKLFADHNWSQINQVYASGQGETRMAFVKDDIGNWNLKSFANQPGSLLDAYTNITSAVVKTAVDAASGGASGAKFALDMLGRMATPSKNTTPTAAGINISAVTASFHQRLENLKTAKTKKRETEKADAVTSVQETAKGSIALLKEYVAFMEYLEQVIVEEKSSADSNTDIQGKAKALLN